MTVQRAAGAGAHELPSGLVDRLARDVVAGPSADTVTTVAPFTGKPLATLPVSSLDDVDTAFEVARVAQREWARRSVRERARSFLRLHDLVLDRQDEALDLIQIESGKARIHAFEEVADVALTSRYYARRAAALLRTRRRSGAVPLLTAAHEVRHPWGVVGIVSPWNYPLSLAVGDAIPALLAGNAVVHRPDTQAALTALWVRDLLVEAGLPGQLWQVVLGEGPVIGDAVVERGDYLMFTGSSRTGRHVAQRAAARLVACSLELGGKNAMIVLDDADVDRAARGTVHAAFSSTGQLCISVERLYVHDRVYDAFVERFLDRVRRLRFGSGLDFSADVGSLVSERQLASVVRHVEDARAKGARVLAGGRPRPDVGPFFYEPTVLEEVTSAMFCHAEETFGPVVSLYRVGSEDEAVRRANDSPYGLNASVWTRDLRRGQRVARRLRAGTVNVNEGYAAAWGSVDSPMGGMGDSGLARRHGAEGILKYTEAQTVAAQRFLGFGTPDRVSHEQWAGHLTRLLRVLKRLGAR